MTRTIVFPAFLKQQRRVRSTVEGTTWRSAPRTGSMNASDATDKFSAVFGNNESALVINTPDGIYNDAFNSSWNASGINAALFGFFPD